jgi:hypothetical protein
MAGFLARQLNAKRAKRAVFQKRPKIFKGTAKKNRYLARHKA